MYDTYNLVHTHGDLAFLVFLTQLTAFAPQSVLNGYITVLSESVEYTHIGTNISTFVMNAFLCSHLHSPPEPCSSHDFERQKS